MSYFLPDGYIERLNAPQSYDIGGDDTWQREVYEASAVLAGVLGLRTILDFGCGSGFKLIKYLSDFDTLGVDLPPAVEALKRTYPNRRWSTLGERMATVVSPPDLLICSDVIEHVDDPDQLLSLFRFIRPKWLIVSTPDRKLMAKYPKWTTKMGPPKNGCHVREWTFGEFAMYISASGFEIIRHWHSNVSQCTQCAIAQIK